MKGLYLAQKKIWQLMSGAELILCLFVIAGVIAALVTAPIHLMSIKTSGLDSFLKYLFDVLIAVELIKLLCSHELSTMVEVLMFAVSRHVIIGHLGAVENLIAILSIAILFAVRKYLFIHRETYEE